MKNLEVGGSFTFQAENNPKYTARAVCCSEMVFKSKHIHVLEWSDQSPDLNTINILWQDLNIDVQWCFHSI